MKEISFILILAIGIVVFWAVAVWIVSYRPPSDWKDVLPAIDGKQPMNITTSTFNVTAEKWNIGWWPSGSSPRDRCVIEIYNASTNMKLQEFTLSTHWPEVSTGTEDMKTTGSFYLKIQVYKSGADVKYAWTIAVREYRPDPPYRVWIIWAILIGIAMILVYISYETYKVLRQ